VDGAYRIRAFTACKGCRETAKPRRPDPRPIDAPEVAGRERVAACAGPLMAVALGPP
jgi:hypothetical protein